MHLRSSPLAITAVLVAVLLLPAMSRAVVVLPKGASKPVMGYLVRQDDRAVVIREILPDGKPREQSIARDQIDELILTVLPERLTELDPARPQLYREYAEELAEKRRDPEARDMALRLYHMAAVLGDGALRRGALLGLAELARSPQEERRFRAAAYLYDPEHDAALLAGDSDARVTSTPNSTESLKELLAALRLARQGKGGQVKAIVEKPAIQEQLAGLSKIIAGDELAAACTAKNLSDEQLYKLLKAETAIEASLSERGPAAASELAAPSAGWSAAVKSRGLGALPSLALDSLTEFNPRQCVYRDGKWVEP
jgi:hypothetical protein